MDLEVMGQVREILDGIGRDQGTGERKLGSEFV